MSALRMSAAELVKDWLCLGCWGTAREGGALSYLLILRWAAGGGRNFTFVGSAQRQQLSLPLNPGGYVCIRLGLPVTPED